MLPQEALISTAEWAGAAGAVVGTAVGAVAMRLAEKTPFIDEGSHVYATPDFETMEAVLEVCEANGLEPGREITDEKVVRALMSDTRTIINVTREEVLEEMGDPAGALMFPVKKPVESGEEAVGMLKKRGLEAEVIDPLGDQTEGEMVFVKVEGLPWLLGFRRHVLKMGGGMPPKWDRQKTLDFAKPDQA